jgi:hypothetical protein
MINKRMAELNRIRNSAAVIYLPTIFITIAIVVFLRVFDLEPRAGFEPATLRGTRERAFPLTRRMLSGVEKHLPG